MLRAYYRLIKPGIVYGNVFTVLAGFLFASRLDINVVLLFSVLIGMALVIASSCVFNNVLDRGIDAQMTRTQDRPLVTGIISVRRALLFGAVLGVAGVMVLASSTNALTAGVGLFGVVFYVLVYGIAKRVRYIGTVVGSIAGAVPILSGYTAFTNTIDTSGLLLFLILVLWQMPHFYSIAIYRLEEYAAAGIPTLPHEAGIFVTKVVIAAYIVAFTVAEVLFTLRGETGFIYLSIVLGFGIAWFARAVHGFRANDDAMWARHLFFFSIQVLFAFSVAISFGAVLP